ncbi:ABC transporter ATP-binding protein [Bordetella genomosp. 5]|uniref:Iron ABC transporter ATP-binding protein n=1 Tax=Bordetella genomosp. 5 TaxID=1395608 RepID=A0A261TQG6_9BORD|nr:ABC transporter ATP-binding protein [Bordetella genomosp. 5]OZI51859.1 iron ABC transporter ATP-binding protein [Bordetella genomosp. 5]
MSTCASSGLSLTGVQAGYGRRQVLHGIDAAGLAAGSVTALIGPNGSGKSTLLRAMAGLVPLSAGAVWLGDLRLDRLRPAQRAQHAMYMPQTLPAGVHMTVLESVLAAGAASAPSNAGADASDRLAQAIALLGRLGIAGLANRTLAELSGGQRQMTGLAQALIRAPRLLLLDEPLSALDLNYQFHVMRLLARETRERGMVTVIVLHDLGMALNHTDQALLLQAGRLLARGTPREVIVPARLREAYGVQARILSDGEARHVHVEDLVAEPT